MENEKELRIFYDRFACHPVTERSNFSPPERYYEILCNTGDNYIEEWYCGGDKYVDVYYTTEEWELANDIRKSAQRNNDVELQYIVRYYVPKDVYNDLVEYMK